jgi:hypothetical protein
MAVRTKEKQEVSSIPRTFCTIRGRRHFYAVNDIVYILQSHSCISFLDNGVETRKIYTSLYSKKAIHNE